MQVSILKHTLTVCHIAEVMHGNQCPSQNWKLSLDSVFSQVISKSLWNMEFNPKYSVTLPQDTASICVLMSGKLVLCQRQCLWIISTVLYHWTFTGSAYQRLWNTEKKLWGTSDHQMTKTDLGVVSKCCAVQWEGDGSSVAGQTVGEDGDYLPPR